MVTEFTGIVRGLSCASCVRRLETALKAAPGVEAVRVNLADAKAHLTLAAGTKLDDIKGAAREAGYPISDVNAETSALQEAETKSLITATWIAAALVAPVFVVEMGSHLIPGMHHALHGLISANTIRVLSFLLVGIALAGPGRIFFAKGIPALLRGQPDMNALVALGTGAAFLYSTVATFWPTVLPEGSANVYFEAAGVIVVLILLGRSLEARAKGRTGAAIRALADLSPDTALVLRDGVTEETPTDALSLGDIIRLLPGARVAIDGQVIEGQSFVDESMITGEPLPVKKSPGNKVTGGTMNTAGTLTFEVTAAGSETVLFQIITMVRNAQSTKLSIQSLVDQVTAWFVPAILLIAAVTVIAWVAFGPRPSLGLALVAGVSVLIIACPCAMGLATPTSIIVGIGRAAQMGVLFRQGEALQTLGGVKTVVFDKTGTLTMGSPSVCNVITAPDFDRNAVLGLAASVEALSEHPIAKAIVQASPGINPVKNFQTTTGEGVSATVGGQTIRLGNAAFLEYSGIDTAQFASQAAASSATGDTVIYVSVNKMLAALIIVADSLRDEALDVITDLQSRGINVALASGDSEAATNAIAQKLGIDHVMAAAKPGGKSDLINQLKQDGSVAFVGDGINDAPALAAADVGIAIGSGTDIAMEAADVVLTSPDLKSVGAAIKISQATMGNIRQNLGWAFGYNALLIPVAAGVLYPVWGLLLSPMLAASAMAFSSIAVVLNALRLKRVGETS